MKKVLAAALLLTGLTLAGCNGGGSPTFFTGPIVFPTVTTVNQSQVAFNPFSGSLDTIPFPDDILRNPSTGQNALPAATSTSEPQAAFNSLNGFSTAGTVAVPFIGAIDPTTVNPQTVLVLDAHGSTPVTAPITYSVTSDGNGNSIINLTPTVPLNPGHDYLVIVTGGVKTAGDEASLASNPLVALTKQTTSLIDTNGNSLVTGLSNQEAQVLEGIREELQPAWSAASQITGQPVANIPEVFTFGTQQLFGTMTALATAAQAAPPTPDVPDPSATLAPPPPTSAPTGNPTPSGTPLVVPNPITTTTTPSVAQFVSNIAPNYLNDSIVPPPTNAIGQIVFGSFQAPNYQNPAASPSSLPGSFVPSNTNLPQQFGTNTVNFIVCYPAGASGPVPTVIFQHGFTRTNFDVFFIANSLCSQGVAVIAINLQLHGDRALSGEPSGTGFADFVNLLVARDNIRQSVSDQQNLASMIASGNAASIGLLDQDPQYVGQSLGGILGGIFLATDNQVPTGVLNVAGGRWTSLILNSPGFSSLFTGPSGLPAFGLQPGTPEFNQFLYIAQTVLDDADPFNYAPHLGLTQPTVVNLQETRVQSGRDLAGGTNLSVLIQEMIGDQEVPNSATSDLGLAAGITQVNAIQQISTPDNSSLPFTLPQVTITTSQGAVGSGLYQFQGGQHGFLLSPSSSDPNGILTFEGQEQVGAFLLSALDNSGVGTIFVPQPPVSRVGTPPTTPNDVFSNPWWMFFGN
ncbi:MAG TPA: Ig-like domain-containing protein [Candidatus Xenobia bacterium]|jgi:hypothetical protein